MNASAMKSFETSMLRAGKDALTDCLCKLSG